MSKNNITGDEIQTKSYSKDGRENHDRIFRKQNAWEWCREIYGETRVIYDPDGWRHNDGVTMETPINRADFDKRFNESTVLGFLAREKLIKVNACEETKPFCMKCGQTVVPNIPRMGWDGGTVHEDGTPTCVVPYA